MLIENKNVEIIYEDEYLLVAVKPQEIPVQSDKTGDLDFLSVCKNHYEDLFLIHRLDRPVGGTMVFAKDRNIAQKLNSAMSNGEFNKEYLAVVKGISKENDELFHYLLKNERLNKSKVVQKGTHKAKEARLKYSRIEVANHKNEDYSLINVNLLTGRHHQIRLQLKTVGIPIVGDRKYNDRNYFRTTLGLWSHKLSFNHPITDEFLEFKAFPRDIKAFDLFENSSKEGTKW